MQSYFICGEECRNKLYFLKERDLVGEKVNKFLEWIVIETRKFWALQNVYIDI